MKTYCLVFALLIIALDFSFGKIKNGYANEIVSARGSLIGLRALLQREKEIKGPQKKLIESKVKALVNYITYYELTENLLSQFKLIATAIYNEIDTIKDRQGRSTDVYIKFIPKDQTTVQAWGITNIAQATCDNDAYYSEYGARSVSVKVWIVSKALEVLSHELGHVKYQVPNLACYMEYYKMNYRSSVTDANSIGHESDDKSGRYALAYARKYRENYSIYLMGGHNQLQSPLALVENLKKEVLQEAMLPTLHRYIPEDRIL